MNPTYDFSGQVALVTGASSGMGLATAEAYAESGAAVVLTDVNQPALQAATDELADRGHQVLAVVCDVADETVSPPLSKPASTRSAGSIMRSTTPASRYRRAMPPTSPPRSSTASTRSTSGVCGPA